MMEIGYKKTILGLIPSHWKMGVLNDLISDFSAGVSVNSEDRKINDGEIGVLKVSAVSNEYFCPDEHKAILPKEVNRVTVYPKAGNIIISRANTFDLVGASAYIENDYPKLFLSDKLWQTNFSKNNESSALWLNYWLKLGKVRLMIKNIATGTSGSMKNITQSDFLNLPVPIPPLPEQTAIAHVLGLMDKAIQLNNQLIAQKELRKKWLMQQLLTGKKRVKGFGGVWKEVHIRDVAKEVSIRNKTDKQLTVLSCTKYDGLVPSLDYFGRKIFSDDVSTYKVVPKHHFAYATNHIEEGSIGYQDAFEEALISPMYTVFKTNSNINDFYFFKLLKSHQMVFQYNARMEGSIDRRGGLRWDAFSIIKFHLPSLEEQAAIAQILQAVDRELQLLREKVERLREQKKGVMGVLLTGKKRLKID